MDHNTYVMDFYFKMKITAFNKTTSVINTIYPKLKICTLKCYIYKIPLNIILVMLSPIKENPNFIIKQLYNLR